GGYAPLDPAYPEERLNFMLADSAPVALLTQSHLRSVFKELSASLPVIDISEVSGWLDQPESNPDRGSTGLSPEHLAYVIYTSGSTGTPKGVMVGQGNVVRLLRATDGWFQFGPADVWTLFHSYAFDFSVWELWGALAYGGRLVVVPQVVSRSPEEFYRLLCREGVTVLNQTPGAFQRLIAAQAVSAERHSFRCV